MTYAWSQLDGNDLSNEKSFYHKFKYEGTYEITVAVTDEQNLSDFDTVLVTVKKYCKK
jgi:PKD repeat protein